MLCWRLVQEFLLVYHKKENPLPASSRKILKIVAWLQLNLKNRFTGRAWPGSTVSLTVLS